MNRGAQPAGDATVLYAANGGGARHGQPTVNERE